MIKLEPGIHQLWPRFSQSISSPLSFEMGKIYHLKGDNGSGKSSFIQKILLPIIQTQGDAYIIYLQQQMHLQLYALRAYAAVNGYGKRIVSEQDAVDFLVQDLLDCYSHTPKDVYLLSDESNQLHTLAKLSIPACLVYIAHHEEIFGAQNIYFKAIKDESSEVQPDL